MSIARLTKTNGRLRVCATGPPGTAAAGLLCRGRAVSIVTCERLHTTESDGAMTPQIQRYAICYFSDSDVGASTLAMALYFDHLLCHCGRAFDV